MTRSTPETLQTRKLLDHADARLVAWMSDRVRGAASPEEVDAFSEVVFALCIARSEGSLGLPLDESRLESFVRRGVDRDEGLQGSTDREAGARIAHAARDIVVRFLDAANAERFNTVQGPPGTGRPLVRTSTLLAFHRDWFAERAIADGLAALRAVPVSVRNEERILSLLQETLVTRPLRARDGSRLELTPRQHDALLAALREQVFVLAGGPGTGKTTWTAAWLRAVLRLPGVTPERVRLCAPTGRAARRLEESLRATLAYCLDDPRDAAAAALPVTTLHTLLGWRAFEGRFARTPGDPLDADWVLLDEASMADVHLMAALVRALRPGARLVLAGDPGQLPAVEAGAVLGELLPAADGEPGPVPSVTLDASHRATGDVIPLAAAIRAGRGDDVVSLLGFPEDPAAAFAPDRALTRVEASDDATAHGVTEHLSKVLHAYADAAFGKSAGGSTASTYAALLESFRTLAREDEPAAAGALWNLAGRARVLAPLRQGTVSAESANRILRQRLEPAWRHRTDGRDPKGFHGAPILITRNDARTGLSNGDLGLWLETGDGATVFFPRPELPGGWLRLPVALLPAWELGFASTVHKSQGSECDEVLVLLPAADNRLLVRETLYTAVTRARKTVRIYGSDLAIRQAVERRLQRYGGLREMMAAA